MIDSIKKFIPSFIRHDFLRKLIALSFAVLVYFMVSNQMGKEDTIEGVKVNISLPDSLMGKYDNMVKVRVIASEKRLNRLTPSDLNINLVVKKDNYIPGKPYALQINPHDVKAPIGVTVIGVDPNEITLYLDEKISQTANVEANFARLSLLPDGYKIGKIEIEPPQVELIGPKTLVESMDVVRTQPIPLDGSIIEPFDMRIKLENTSKNIKIEPDAVHVRVNVVKEYDSKMYKAVPIKILEMPDDARFKVELTQNPNVDITLSGQKSMIEMLKKSQLKAYIDVSQFDEPGLYTVQVGCWIGVPGVTVKAVVPDKVQVKLTKK
jgi:YbbR domain-containing protein